eukprot:6492384-Amphidinium_carterae.11
MSMQGSPSAGVSPLAEFSQPSTLSSTNSSSFCSCGTSQVAEYSCPPMSDCPGSSACETSQIAEFSWSTPSSCGLLAGLLLNVGLVVTVSRDECRFVRWASMVTRIVKPLLELLRLLALPLWSHDAIAAGSSTVGLFVHVDSDEPADVSVPVYWTHDDIERAFSRHLALRVDWLEFTWAGSDVCPRAVHLREVFHGLPKGTVQRQQSTLGYEVIVGHRTSRKRGLTAYSALHQRAHGADAVFNAAALVTHTCVPIHRDSTNDPLHDILTSHSPLLSYPRWASQWILGGDSNENAQDSAVEDDRTRALMMRIPCQQMRNRHPHGARAEAVILRQRDLSPMSLGCDVAQARLVPKSGKPPRQKASRRAVVRDIDSEIDVNSLASPFERWMARKVLSLERQLGECASTLSSLEDEVSSIVLSGNVSGGVPHVSVSPTEPFHDMVPSVSASSTCAVFVHGGGKAHRAQHDAVVQTSFDLVVKDVADVCS